MYQSRLGFVRDERDSTNHGCLIRRMVRHEIDDHANAAAMSLRYEAIERGKIAEVGMDAAVVADVVAPVLERRRVDGIQPDGVDAERLEIVEMRGDAVEVADAVAVRVGKRARINLIEDASLPPLKSHRCDQPTCEPIMSA